MSSKLSRALVRAGKKKEHQEQFFEKIYNKAVDF